MLTEERTLHDHCLELVASQYAMASGTMPGPDEFIAAARKYLAFLSEGRSSQMPTGSWQPIPAEPGISAPFDHKPVLLRINDGTPWVGAWRVAHYTVNGVIKSDDTGFTNNSRFASADDAKPTHWCPIPEFAAADPQGVSQADKAAPLHMVLGADAPESG